MNLYNNAVIFAGGKSRRMGQDKALLPFGKHPSLSYFQYHKLQTLFEHVYLSTKEDKFTFDAPCIYDTGEEASPLVALLSVFETLDTEEIFVLSVDAPFVDASVIDTLMSETWGESDVIVAESPSGLQPLCARYHRSVLPLLKQQFRQNNHKLKDLLDLASSKVVYFKDDTLFTNLNHPNEYEEALKRFL